MNYEFFVTNPGFITAIGNTLILLLSVLIITVVLGVALSALSDTFHDEKFAACQRAGDFLMFSD